MTKMKGTFDYIKGICSSWVINPRTRVQICQRNVGAANCKSSESLSLQTTKQVFCLINRSETSLFLN